jgi:hypothetical protein
MTAQSAISARERQSAAWRIWLRWALATAAGETFGFAIPALAGGAAFWLALDQIAMSALLALAGLGEGALLGLAQWLALRAALPELAGRRWVLATAGAAGLAWALAMTLVTLGERGALGPTALALLAVPLGAVFLCSIGGAQWLVLRHHVARAGWWILANAIAWPLGVAIPVAGMALLPDTAGAVTMIAVGVVCGLLMGVLVGAITGFALVYLLGHRGGSASVSH